MWVYKSQLVTAKRESFPNLKKALQGSPTSSCGAQLLLSEQHQQHPFGETTITIVAL